MKRVLIIGCPGAGKSTFARALTERTELPLFHLDLLYWNADRTTVPKEVFLARLDEVLASDAWIIDGNYGGTMEKRLAACDTVFFLDYPLDVCLEGLCTRRGKPRPDMPWIEREDEVDEEFLAFVRNYSEQSRPRVLELLARHTEKTIIIFHSRNEAEHYMETL